MWQKDLPFSDIPSVDRRRARELCKKFHSADQAVEDWPIDDRWLLPLLGLPHGMLDLDAFVTEVASEPLSQGRVTYHQIQDWAQRLGIADLLEEDRITLERISGEYIRFYGTVEEALATQYWVRDDLADSLEEIAVARHHIRLWELERRPTWARGPLRESLKPAWSVVYRAYRKVRGRCVATQLDDVQLLWDPMTLITRQGTQLMLEPPELFEHEPAGLMTLLDLFSTEQADSLADYLAQPSWMRDLGRLDPELTRPEPEPDDKPLLGWVIVERGGEWSIKPVRCRPKKRGSGYLTRRILCSEVPLSLCTEPTDELLQGRLIRGALVCSLLPLLVGHPRVFLEGNDQVQKGIALDLRQAHCAVGLMDRDDSVALGLMFDGRPLLPETPRHVEGDLLVEITPTALTFAPIGHAERALLQALNRRAIEVPKAEVSQLLERMPKWSKSVDLHADPGVLGPSVEADLRPVVRLEMLEDGLSVEVRVQPLPEVASTVPGEGSSLIAAVRDGAPVHIQRDFAAECASVDTALAPLGLPAHTVSPYRWHLRDMQAILRAVEACRGASDSLRVRWGGPCPTLADRRAQATDLKLRVESSRDWFGVGGELRVGKHRVPMKSLIAAATEGHAFVPLSDNQWLGLSDGLRAHLADLAAIGGDSNGRVSLGPLHTALLDPLLEDGAELDAPPAWFDLADRLAESADLELPLPTGLNATLRPYQAKGVEWLMRMAHWAPGACLADDMGLGKTIQALALLLHRAEGPSLVVAPASVMINWRRELERFAPSLRPRLYWGPGRSVDGIGAGDVVFTTYGTLQRDAEVLAKISFRTTVLDEAQAIKNPSALRSKAAFGLQSDFCLALSGTPVENRTEELWSLFRYIAPGLLGSRARFNRVFVHRIEALDDRQARSRLAHLVGPFLLRRTKSAVATDLPARTEMVHRVELSASERALYDRTRLECIARLEAAEGGHIQAAAELLKLRKLACHPRLYDPGSPIHSSKLHAVVRSARDLRESGHRALIFSQFTTHLALAREALEAEGFSIRYLDGKMSLKARQAEVDAFQAGEGDLFLISLKAGGTGLNLTGATYVFHLDPWWNPAAEDQATDRAHRIGQTQAVTVMRFVTANTVEEQIVEMHHDKRALAEALLSGQSGGVRLDPDVVLGMLRTSLEDAVEIDPTPLPAIAALPDRQEDLLERFGAHLQEEGRRKSTIRAYTKAMERMIAWMPQPPDPASIAAHGPQFVALARKGEAGTKSDKVYARPALRSLLGMLEG